jgi:DNA polymerase-3 subunit gamma/tau
MSELYKKYRPKTLEEVVGNRTTVKALKGYLAKGNLPHTVLLHGPSGCGKTTLGRIIRRALGCSKTDYRELNCSDFRGIDTVREISRNMTLAPIGGKCRVFLLDEVHQLSKDGQNAALKILEDTPSHVYFILCTTDPGKLLKTIVTRCCQLPVSPLDEEEASGLVQRVAKAAGVSLSKDHLDELVGAAEGSARTALVLLDKLSQLDEGERSEGLKKIKEQEAQSIELCRALIKKARWPEVAKILRALPAGEEESVRWAVLGYARAVLLGGQFQAYNVICAFEQNFYDSKATGLARACYEAIHGGGD